MSIGPRAACLKCARKREGDEGWYCEAFPEGMPDEILSNGNPHTSPVEGDHGILFTPKEGGKKAR